MTASELIEHLRAQPDDATAVPPLQEGQGYTAVCHLHTVSVRRVAPETPVEYRNELDRVYESTPFVPDETVVVIEFE